MTQQGAGADGEMITLKTLSYTVESFRCNTKHHTSLNFHIQIFDMFISSLKSDRHEKKVVNLIKIFPDLSIHFPP